ncbi:MAG: N-acetylmuramoyl-L-alanine amidase [bacterium]|nr:N-acetylmuramoyl-L-alanine amidase [bacterium]
MSSPRLPEITRPAAALPALGSLLLVLTSVLCLAPPAAAATRRAALSSDMVAALDDDQEIFIEAAPQRGEGLLAFSRRLTGDSKAARTISQHNRKTRRLLAGVRYRVPYELLLEELKFEVVRALFTSNVAQPDGWLHVVPTSDDGHSLWRIGVWFTGRGQSFIPLREHNRMTENTVGPGESLLIPAYLLLPAFRAALPPPESPYNLDYGQDDDGGYVVYRLRQGEALYSAVVVRFTGRTYAEDVNALSAELAELNGIRDVTDIPVGKPIRIPFDLLLPEFLPPSDPRRQEYDKARSESAKYSNTVRTSTLEGITVILDAGHGGQDPGAAPGGVWESIHVYDVMLRVKEILEAETAATVAPTTRDGTSFKISDRDVLPKSNGHAVLTDPIYPVADSTIGTHLRWYLANSLHAAAVRRSGDPDKTVFISIHADSLHASLRGAMAYVPAAGLTQGEYGKSGRAYTSRREVLEKPRVSFSWTERVRSEGLSRQLAARLMASFRGHGLAIHPEQEVRDRIIRCRRCRPFVPAVIRRNAVPAKLLLEISNLNNQEDRRLLRTRAFRQKVAEAIVDGILAYYGQAPSEPAAQGK